MLPSNCGVSVTTVSRVINNSDQVTEETKRKVLKVIDELGFIPNTNARGLSTKSTNTVGIIVPNVSNPFFGELIEGAEGAASEKGHKLAFEYKILLKNRRKKNRWVI